MTEEKPAKRGDAAWKEHLDGIARRNADARSRAHAEDASHGDAVQNRLRERVRHEAAQVQELNARIDRRAAGPGAAGHKGS